MAEKAPTVYVSITTDLREYRHLVIEACQAMGMQTLMLDSGPEWETISLEEAMSQMNGADIYLGVIGREYDVVPRGDNRPLVEMEYDYAATRGIPCFIYMMEEAA
jgi:uncharacterized protein DUF4062